MRRQSTARGMAGARLVPRRRLQHRHASNLGCFRLRHQAEGQVRHPRRYSLLLPFARPRNFCDKYLGMLLREASSGVCFSARR